MSLEPQPLPEFKLIVAGGRDFHDFDKLSRVLYAMADVEFANYNVSIVSGMAPGADSLAVKFARELDIKLYEFPADWRPHGIFDKGAGHKRNERMGRFADGLLAFWDSKSRGTAHMITFMRSLRKPVHIVGYNLPFSADGLTFDESTGRVD